MSQRKSLGIIETAGLLSAIEAADTAVKSADVKLVGYELTRGGGWTMVKIEGNIGAVKAAIKAAEASLLRMGTLVSTKVIARPSDEIKSLIRNESTVGYKDDTDKQYSNPSNDNHGLEKKYIELDKQNIKNIEMDSKFIKADETFEKKNIDEFDNVSKENQLKSEEKSVQASRYTCNICKDPKCPRHKGELKSTCIHYKKKK